MLKVVGLVSGGKDSIYNLMQCRRYGHKIVCLANICPEGPNKSGELPRKDADSFMYQTVGHESIRMQAAAMGLPLYTRQSSHVSVDQTLTYQSGGKNAVDEVEDLFVLLAAIKKLHPEVNAVSSGAVLSTYQRLRVESVASRLGLTSLAYLWAVPQQNLLVRMLRDGVQPVIVKIASDFLSPSVLGRGLSCVFPKLIAQPDMLHPCGEGGEYETFVVWCPLFRGGSLFEEPVGSFAADHCDSVVYLEDGIVRAALPSLPPCLDGQAVRLVLGDSRVVTNADASGPGAFLSFNASYECFTVPQTDDAITVPQTDDATTESTLVIATGELFYPALRPYATLSPPDPLRYPASSDMQLFDALSLSLESSALASLPRDGYFSYTHYVRVDDTGAVASSVPEHAVCSAVRSALSDVASRVGATAMQRLASVHVALANLSIFASINTIMKETGVLPAVNPPARACIELPFPRGIVASFEFLFAAVPPQSLHIQSISEWAPACIGPYGQAAACCGDNGSKVWFVSGTIPLDAPRMIVSPAEPASLVVRHLSAVCSDPTTVLSSLCFARIFIVWAVSWDFAESAIAALHTALATEWDEVSKSQGVKNLRERIPLDVIVSIVPMLPRGVSVEIEAVLLSHYADETPFPWDLDISVLLESNAASLPTAHTRMAASSLDQIDVVEGRPFLFRSFLSACALQEQELSVFSCIDIIRSYNATHSLDHSISIVPCCELGYARLARDGSGLPGAIRKVTSATLCFSETCRPSCDCV